jgi:membrane associated rhomboid family serine protease
MKINRQRISHQRHWMTQIKTRLSTLGKDLYLLVMIVVFMWLLEIINSFYHYKISSMFGIRPHTMQGLLGIFCAPFLHASTQHITANTFCFFVLGALIMLRGRSDFFWVSVCATIGPGLGTWLLASSNSIHVGASGLIFGYLGFLIAIGYFERSILAITVAIFVTAVYGSLLWGILPLAKGVSWQMHFLGLMSGIWAATTLHRILNRRS